MLPNTTCGWRRYLIHGNFRLHFTQGQVGPNVQQRFWRAAEEVVLALGRTLCSVAFRMQKEPVIMLRSFLLLSVIQFSDVHDSVAFCIHRKRSQLPPCFSGFSYLWVPSWLLNLHFSCNVCSGVKRSFEGSLQGSVDREAC